MKTLCSKAPPSLIRLGLIWRVAAWFLLPSCTWAAAGDSGSGTPPPPLAKVLGVERHAQKDQLLLNQGDRISGLLLNPAIGLRTSYASLALEQRWIAGIELDQEGRQPAQIITVNSNRFSGLLEDAAFIMELASGKRIEVRREKVAKLIRHVDPQERQENQGGQWIRLKNGDVFSGKILKDQWVVTSVREKNQVKWSDVTSIVFPNGKLPILNLRQGGRIEGTLDLEDWPVLLDIGLTVNLYTEVVASIGDQSLPGIESSSRTALSPIPYAMTLSGQTTNAAGMIWIPAGKFTMGSPNGEAGRDQDEGPQTQVTFEQGFWIGQYEVTQAEYLAVTGNNPSNVTEDPARPVEKVNWNEAMDFCEKLTRLAQEAHQLPEGYHYRLPTEAEWEYACRAGTSTRFSFGDDKNYTHLEDYAWYVHNSDSMTHPVGTLRPNPWGLFDMHGNVWEWCLDRWEGQFSGGSITNFPSRSKGTLRVARGGSWLYEGWACRSANRDDLSPANRCSDVGFRVVLAPIPSP